MKFAIFWDRAQCSQYMNQRFGETYHLHLQGQESVKQEASKLAGGSHTGYMVLHPRIWQIF
jgi:hypothetical protein